MTFVKISQFNMPTVEVLKEFFILSDFFEKMHYLPHTDIPSIGIRVRMVRSKKKNNV